MIVNMEEPTTPPDVIKDEIKNEESPKENERVIGNRRNLGAYALIIFFYLIIILLITILPPHQIQYIFIIYFLMLVMYININTNVDQVQRSTTFFYGMIIMVLLAMLTTGESISPVNITDSIYLDKYVIGMSVVPLFISFHPHLMTWFDTLFQREV